MFIVLLGPSGCGKGTQADLLAAKLKLPVITMSSLLKVEAVKETERGIYIKEYMEKGLFIDGKIASNILIDYLIENKISSAILDGTHRTIDQTIRVEYALHISGLKIDKVIIFDLSDEECISRIMSRANKLLSEGKAARKDDLSEDSIKNRLNEYKKELELITLYFSLQNNLVSVDASRSIEEIHINLCNILKI